MLSLALLLATGILSQEQDWPREYPGADGGKLVLYQPQVETWEAQSRIHARLALAYSAAHNSA